MRILSAYGAMGRLCEVKTFKPHYDLDDLRKECNSLLETCNQEVYLNNSFRIIGLPVDATAGEIKRRINDLKSSIEMNDIESDLKHAFALPPTPSHERIQAVEKRLQDPAMRIIDELFWFWPEQWGQGRKDLGYDALAENNSALAFKIWETALSDSNKEIAVMAKHNMAVWYHRAALEYDVNSSNEILSDEKIDIISGNWEKSLQLWFELVYDDDIFWEKVADRILTITDANLNPVSATGIRDNISIALDKINAHLALNYAVKGNLKMAEVHLSYVRKNEDRKGSKNIDKLLAFVIKQLETKINSAVTRNDKAQNDGLLAANKLLESTQKELTIIDTFLGKENLEFKYLFDNVAESCLKCYDPDKVKDDWAAWLSVLDSVEKIAIDKEIVTQIERMKQAPVIEIINFAVKTAKKTTTKVPGKGLVAANNLLKSTQNELSLIGQHSVCSYLFNMVADTCLACVISYYNEIIRKENADFWPCLSLLSRIEKMAIDEPLVKEIQRIINVLKEAVKGQCWFCNIRDSDDNAKIEIPMVKRRLNSIDRPEKIKVAVPRCSKCQEKHSLIALLGLKLLFKNESKKWEYPLVLDLKSNGYEFSKNWIIACIVLLFNKFMRIRQVAYIAQLIHKFWLLVLLSPFFIIIIAFAASWYLHSNDYSSYCEKANIAFAGKEYERAIELYNKALNVPGYSNDITAKELLKKTQLGIELKLQFDKLMGEGKNCLERKEWIAAEKIFKDAIKVTGYENDNTAVSGLKLAQYNYENQIAQSKTDWNESRTKVNALLSEVNDNSVNIYKRIESADSALDILKKILGSPDMSFLPNFSKTEITDLKTKITSLLSNLLFNLGLHYEQGKGVDKNMTEAVKWYRKAAEQGYVKAQYNLAVCYYNGAGVTKDMAKAVEWYQKAAEQGFAEAQYRLGVCYANGYGVAKDMVKAVEWYQKAAEQGFAEAQYRLGVCYQNGDGIIEAIEWYQKAAEQGFAEAQYRLGVCYQNGDGVDKNIIEAIEWYQKAAEQGFAEAQYRLGVCYQNGDGVDKNMTKAVELYRKAAAQGHAEAQYNLAVCYYSGFDSIESVAPDMTRAAVWFRKAAEQGYVKAQYNLAVCYYNGAGVTKDMEKAVEWYQKAAEQGFAEAQYNLAVCYYNGDGVDKNIIGAIELYQKAAEQGFAEAQYRLGVCYQNGDGVDKNMTKAVELYRKAAAQGHAEAVELSRKVAEQERAEAVELSRKVAERGHAEAVVLSRKVAEQERAEAVELSRKVAEDAKAVKLSRAEAQYRLGVCYQNGDGVEKNIIKAIELYQKAAEQGCEEAVKRMRHFDK